MSSHINERAQAAHRITLIGTIADILLGAGKITVGLFSHSYGLVVDGIHSLSDLFSDFVLLGVIKYSQHGADDEHPYGHLRFETMATLLLGWLLIAVAGFLIYDNVERILHHEVVHIPTWPALVAITVSIVIKEALYHYTRKVGERIRSDMIIANAWHTRSDAWCSMVVMVGIIGSMFGAGWLDITAAIVVAVIIGKMGWDFAWTSTEELVDTGISIKETNLLKATAQSVEGVKDIHFIRGRRMGPHILLELHIEVSADVSVSEGHHIGACVAHYLMEQHDDVADVTFHIDAEDDGFGEMQYSVSAKLPNRQEILDSLKSCWQLVQPAPQILQIMPHYLKGKINVEVFLAHNHLDEEERDAYLQQLKNSAVNLPWLGEISVWYK